MEGSRAGQRPEHLSVRNLLAAMGQWLKTHLVQATLITLAGAAGGFALNYALARFGWTGPLTPTAADPTSLARAAAVWMVASTILFTLAGYWWTVGTRKFFASLARFPSSLASLVRTDGRAARVHLLWGAGLALLASTLISPAAGALVAVLVVMSLPSLLGGILASLLHRLWSTLVGLIAPTRRRPIEGAVKMAVGLAGSVLALAVGYLMDATSPRLMLAAGCIGLAILLSLVSAGDKAPG